MHKLDEKALAAEPFDNWSSEQLAGEFRRLVKVRDNIDQMLTKMRSRLPLASLPSPEQSAAQQPATEAEIGKLRNSSGAIFWSDECQNPVAAIEFALDHIEDHYDRLEFLKSWREDDVVEWPDFIDYAALSQSPSKPAGGTDENH